jgi:kynurenine formamidase
VTADGADLSTADFRRLFESLRAWGRWGPDDERGALNLLTPQRIAAAASLVREGRAVGLAHPLDTRPSADNPVPAEHRMTMLPPPSGADAGIAFIKDFVGVDYHNDTHSHLDALCHVAFDGRLYNDRPADAVTQVGAVASTVEVAADGLVGRGVLLDIPPLRSVPWLEPGTHVLAADLEAAVADAGLEIAAGDIVLVRTGHSRRLAELGPWDTAARKAGLHPGALGWLAEREIAALGSDGNNDTAPSSTEGVDFPIHVLAITAMGVHLFDYLDLDGLAAACEQVRRWEFLLVAAPLRIRGGTGSPLNPIALL